MDKHSRVFGLDLMRAVAIGLVLFSHATLFLGSHSSIFGVGLLAGYFGVELFFVLSGFLIGGILLRLLAEQGASLAALKNFWLRRWFRTLPNYFLFLALNLLIALCYSRALPALWPYVFFLQNFSAPPAGFFVESWSLAVEEWFYLLLPLVVFAIARRKAQRANIAVLLLLFTVAVTVARTIYVSLADPVWLTDVRMIVVFRLDACMFGVAGAWWKYYHPLQWRKATRIFPPLGLATLALVALAPFNLASDSNFMRTSGFTLTSLGALFLLPALDRWQAGRGIASKGITKISLWSYSLYLVNYPLYILLHEHGKNFPPIALALIFSAIAIVAAAIIYCVYELPMMNLRERWASRSAMENVPSIAILDRS